VIGRRARVHAPALGRYHDGGRYAFELLVNNAMYLIRPQADFIPI